MPQQHRNPTDGMISDEELNQLTPQELVALGEALVQHGKNLTKEEMLKIPVGELIERIKAHRETGQSDEKLLRELAEEGGLELRAEYSSRPEDMRRGATSLLTGYALRAWRFGKKHW